MTRELPKDPNLEFLRKQAKELLRNAPGGKLADVQHRLANDYGFATWAQLKSYVITLGLSPAAALTIAVCDGDDQRVRDLLNSYPELRATIDKPLTNYGHGQHALFAAVQRSDKATIDALLRAGADVCKRTEWWAGGFSVLDDCDPSLADFLVERGAIVDIHAAVRLGRISRIKELLSANPSLIQARGGDGQMPLHFAPTVEIAKLLLDHGAEIDALDVNHESTPAQYMLRVLHKRHYPQDRQAVARYLVSRGCKSDLLMAAALGDMDLARHHLDTNPGCIRMCVTEDWFPKHDSRSSGTIYLEVLGANRTAHVVARDFGHEHLFVLLMERTPEDMQLALAFDLGDREVFQRFLARHPEAIRALSQSEQEKLPNAAQSNNTNAVRLMLEAGWPVDTPGELGATALHWAAFNGNSEMTQEILRFHPQVELKSREYSGSALYWALYASGNSWRRETGDYVGTVLALLEAGAIVPEHPESLEPSDAVLEVLP